MSSDPYLHILTRALLNVCPPMWTHAILMRLGRRLRPNRIREDIRTASLRLAGQGTCLSRALTLAARTPASEVVIGVERRHGGGFAAHAWLEVGGRPFDGSEPRGLEIARLPGRRA